MSGLGKALLSPLGAALGVFKAPKVPQLPAATPYATRDLAAEAAAQTDALRRRRGAGANELTGGGAEAITPGGKTLLGL